MVAQRPCERKKRSPAAGSALRSRIRAAGRPSAGLDPASRRGRSGAGSRPAWHRCAAAAGGDVRRGPSSLGTAFFLSASLAARNVPRRLCEILDPACGQSAFSMQRRAASDRACSRCDAVRLENRACKGRASCPARTERGCPKALSSHFTTDDTATNRAATLAYSLPRNCGTTRSSNVLRKEVSP